MNVIIADQHGMMREGLRVLLNAMDIGVVGEVADGDQAVAEAKRLRPDVVVMDIWMPKLSGIEATRRLTSDVPNVKVLGLGTTTERRHVIAMLQAGASGYMLKNGGSEELRCALEVVTRGQKYVCTAVAGSLVDEAIGPRSRGSWDMSTTPREREVLKLIAEGKSSKKIAAILNIAVPTVETHRRQLAAKLKLRSIAEQTKYAIREGLTSVDA